jgi:hypothetical protein
MLAAVLGRPMGKRSTCRQSILQFGKPEVTAAVLFVQAAP